MPMIPAMQILCIFGVVRSINSTVGPLFLGIGKPDILPKITIYQIILMGILIYPLTKAKGIFGTSIAITLPYIIVMIYLSIKMLPTINLRLKHLLQMLQVPFFACLGMIILFKIFRSFIVHMNIGIIIFLVLIIVIFYVGFTLIFDHLFNSCLRENLKQYLKLSQ